MRRHVGISGLGIYLPETYMTAKEIATATDGNWTEEAVTKKLGIVKKTIPGANDGTQEMGVKAALDAFANSDIKPEDIDLVLSIGEEWKEYPLTTSAIYIQEKVGAYNAWGIDIQQRCCTCVAALKIAKDMMISDDSLRNVLIVGGYRNGDFVDYRDKDMSMMYNLSAGGGAVILTKDYGYNELLSSHIMTDGSLARDAGVEIGGTMNPITQDNIEEAYKSLRILDPVHMKTRLNEVSMKNWMCCIDKAFEKSAIDKSQLDYLAVLHFKYSMHQYMLDLLGISQDQSTYLRDFGHMGQIDQILSLMLGIKDNKIKEGSIISMIAAGIGYSWAANVIRWGKVVE